MATGQAMPLKKHNVDLACPVIVMKGTLTAQEMIPCMEIELNQKVSRECAACLQEAHSVLNGALGSAHAPEDSAKDDCARDVAYGPTYVGRLVPADLTPACST